MVNLVCHWKRTPVPINLRSIGRQPCVYGNYKDGGIRLHFLARLLTLLTSSNNCCKNPLPLYLRFHLTTLILPFVFYFWGVPKIHLEEDWISYTRVLSYKREHRGLAMLFLHAVPRREVGEGKFMLSLMSSEKDVHLYEICSGFSTSFFLLFHR